MGNIGCAAGTGAVRSFPELSSSPVFRRQWTSLYAALEDGKLDTDWLRSFLVQQVPSGNVQVFALERRHGHARPLRRCQIGNMCMHRRTP